MSYDVDFSVIGFLHTSQSALSFLITSFCGQHFTFFKNHKKRVHLVYIFFRQLCIKYLISAVMKHYCLRGFTVGVRRVETITQFFCVLIRHQWLFRARAVLCNDPEHVRGNFLIDSKYKPRQTAYLPSLRIPFDVIMEVSAEAEGSFMTITADVK